MAKSRERLLAKELRLQGKSLCEIAKLLCVSKSSVQEWVKDIILTEKQLLVLRNHELKGIEIGRIRSADIHKRERIEREQKYNKIGSDLVGVMSKRELLLIGLALYWAEGSKTGRRVLFVNSDPTMICLFVNWLLSCFEIPLSDLSFRLQINRQHSSREGQILSYWINLLGISKSQFTKTSFIESINAKIYENYQDYYGVLAVKLRRGTNMSYLINGAIGCLRENGKLMIQ